MNIIEALKKSNSVRNDARGVTVTQHKWVNALGYEGLFWRAWPDGYWGWSGYENLEELQHFYPESTWEVGGFENAPRLKVPDSIKLWLD